MLVTSALAGSLRGLGKYLELRSARMPDNDLARQVGVPPWKLKDLSRLSRDWSSQAVSSDWISESGGRSAGSRTPSA